LTLKKKKKKKKTEITDCSFVFLSFIYLYTIVSDLLSDLYGDLARPPTTRRSAMRTHAATTASTTTTPTTTTTTTSTMTTPNTTAVLAHRRAQSLGTWLVPPTGSTAVPVVAMATASGNVAAPSASLSASGSVASPRVVKASPNFDADFDDRYAGLARRPRQHVAAGASGPGSPAVAAAARYNPAIEVSFFFFFFFFFFHFFHRRENFHFSRRIVDIDLGPHSHSKLNHTIHRQCHIIHRNICIRAQLRLLSHRSSNHCSSNRFSNSNNRVVFVE
jgi:hypothetical protein